MKKKVMVLSATYWQVPLIEYLKKLNNYVIVVSPVKNSPAFELADEKYFVDILDKEKCLELAQRLNIDAVMSEECDIANPTIAYISEKLGLESFSRENARLYTDKYEMRKFCQENGFDYPEYKKCYTLAEAENFFDSLKCKMIMKPLDGNSSRGVVTIKEKKEIVEYFEESIKFSKIEKAVICERYIEGKEFTVDGIKTEKEHYSLAISEKRHFQHNPNIACTLFFSHSNNNFNYKQLRKLNDDIVKKSNLKFGLTHAEYKYEDGKWYLIEIGCRGGGNWISSHIVPAISGVDNYKYIIDKVLEHKETTINFKLEKVKEKCAVLQFFDIPLQKGIVKKIVGEEYLKKRKEIVEYKLYCKEGDFVQFAIDDSARIGFYIAIVDGQDKLNQLMKEVRDNVYLEMEEI